MVKVLFVCLGNICRSPLAEGILNHMVRAEKLHDRILCDSAGTGAGHISAPPDRRSKEVALANGIELIHQARQVTHKDAEEFDYIIAMDNSNLSLLKKMAPQHSSKMFKMRDFDSLHPGHDVEDPYYGGINGFHECYLVLHRSCDSFLKHLRETHKL